MDLASGTLVTEGDILSNALCGEEIVAQSMELPSTDDLVRVCCTFA